MIFLTPLPYKPIHYTRFIHLPIKFFLHIMVQNLHFCWKCPISFFPIFNYVILCRIVFGRLTIGKNIWKVHVHYRKNLIVLYESSIMYWFVWERCQKNHISFEKIYLLNISYLRWLSNTYVTTNYLVQIGPILGGMWWHTITTHTWHTHTITIYYFIYIESWHIKWNTTYKWNTIINLFTFDTITNVKILVFPS